MKTTLLLSEADEQRLQALLADPVQGHRPTSEQKKRLQAVLKSTGATTRESATDDRVGFDDRVTLVSPLDSRDTYKLRVVMPPEEDIDDDKISILRPLSLAVIGHRCGEIVEWETPAGRREMRIISVEKAAQRAQV